MRIKIDENLSPVLANWLRRAEHDAVTAIDQHLSGASDSELANICRKEKRAILTLDTDFQDIRRYPPDQFCGIIVLRLHHQGIKHTLAAVERLLGKLGKRSLEGKLCVVSESAVRLEPSQETDRAGGLRTDRSTSRTT